MNVKQEHTKNQKDNINENLLRVKQLICLEKEEKEKQSQIVINLLKGFKKVDLLETSPTIMREQDKHIGPKVDFSYHKICLSFLKNAGIDLELVSSDILVSDSSANMMYIEYYVDRANCCIIFVKYHFNHVRLYSEDGKTNCLTYTFVNTKSEIYYYDEVVNCKLLKKFKLNPDLSLTKDLIRNKTYEIQPMDNRTFKISCSNNSEIFKEKSLSDIHLLIQSLTDILVNEYNDSEIPSNSRIHIETKFLGTSDEATDVQVKAKVNYKYSGVIQITEKISEYEIILYFLDFPEKRVTARFYLTDSEKAKSLVISDNLLENVVLEPVTEIIKDKKFYYKNLYKRYIVKKMNTKKRSSILDPLAKTICENASISSTFVDCPQLQDSFGGIYIEYFKIDAEKICKKFAFKQIRECKLQYDGKSFIQSEMYYAVWNNKVHLIEVYTSYVAYLYSDSCTTIYMPAFGIKDVMVNIINPISEDDVDRFINRISDDKITKLEYSSDQFSRDIKLPNRSGVIHKRDLWRTVFQDFVITTGATRENYQVESNSSSTIYSKLLNCINELRSSDSNFNFSINYPFGYCDEEEPKKRIPLVSNGLTFGYYFDDGFNTISVNSPLKDNCDYTYSSGDDLMRIVFDNDIPYYRTTMHALFKRYENYLYSRSTEIKDTHYSNYINKVDFWKECISFLLNISNENLFK